VVGVSLRGIREGGSSQSRGDGERPSIETSADLKTIQVSLKTSVEHRHGPAFKMVGNPAMWGARGLRAESADRISNLTVVCP
jgi:hypothetical protein